MLQFEFCSKARHSPATSTHQHRAQNDMLLGGFLQVIDLEGKFNAIVETPLPVSSLWFVDKLYGLAADR